MGNVTRRWSADKLGPSKVVFLQLPDGIEAVVVIDNVTLGPGIGGVRMTETVSVSEVARLARAMTLKNAAVLLPYGGAKAGIVIPAGFDPARHEDIIRAFARSIRDLVEYIPGPDMGTTETDMAWIRDEIGRSVGLPRVLGGIPLDEIGATGFGLAVSAEALQEAGQLILEGARVSVQGFGAVGRHAARYLAARGAHVVAVSDSRGAIMLPEGLDIAALVAFKKDHPVAEFPDGKVLDRDDLIGVDCDVLVPAAQPDALTIDNVDRIQARVVLPGANIAVTREAEMALHNRGVLCVPDFIANAGGVICAAVEHRGGDQDQAFRTIREKITANIRELLTLVKSGASPRAAAEQLALDRLGAAAAYRRRFTAGVAQDKASKS
jgi:glutamate dehydrogenase/leucine dehydrogenase